MAQIRQEITIIDVYNTSVGGTDSTSGIIQIDTTKYNGTVTFYFEVVASNDDINDGTAHLRRRGTTTDDATITIPKNTGKTRIRSTSFTPPAGQTQYFLETTGILVGYNAARVIIIQNATITNTQTQIDIALLDQFNSNTTDAPVGLAYWYYDSSKWDGTLVFYAEVTYQISDAMQSVTIKLQEDNGSFASWTDKVTIVSAGVSTTPVRVRSASFTPTSGRNYRTVASITSSMASYDVNCAKIIIDQADSPTKMELQYLIGANIASVPSTGLTNSDSLFDPSEWSGVSNIYIHEANSTTSGTSDLKLQSDPNGTPTDVTNSTITDCIEREQTTALTMPASAQDIDVNITELVDQVYTSRILVQIQVVASTHPLLSLGVGL